MFSGWQALLIMFGLLFVVSKVQRAIQDAWDVHEIKSEQQRKENSLTEAQREFRQRLSVLSERDRLERESKTMYYKVTGTATLYERENRYNPNDFYWYFSEIEEVRYNGKVVPFKINKWNKNWNDIVNPYRFKVVEGPRRVRIQASAWTGLTNNPAPKYVVFQRSQVNGLLEHWKPVGPGEGNRTFYGYQKNKLDHPEIRL